LTFVFALEAHWKLACGEKPQETIENSFPLRQARRKPAMSGTLAECESARGLLLRLAPQANFRSAFGTNTKCQQNLEFFGFAIQSSQSQRCETQKVSCFKVASIDS